MPAKLKKTTAMNKDFKILIAGVGGQGVVTLTQIIAEAAFIEGKDVRTSELHGLSQRGGSVETHIIFGKKVYSPLVDNAKADLILGQEMTEALRKIYYANSKTVFLVNKHLIAYEGSLKEEEIIKNLNILAKGKKYFVEASNVCKKELGLEVLSGVYLLGFAAYNELMPLKPESFLKAIENLMPAKYLESNKKAFELAKKYE